MTIEIAKTRVENLVNLMKGVRLVEGTEIFSGDLWKSSESRREDALVYYIGVGEYQEQGLLLDTGRRYIFVRKEILYIGNYSDTDMEKSGVDVLVTPDGMVYTDHLRIEDWSGSDWVKYVFDPYEDMLFEGGFMDACKYVIDWMSQN